MAVLNEAGMLREIVILAMLEHEDASFCQKVFLEYYIGDGGKVAQSIWRIGKDEIELLFARLDEAEYIATQWYTAVGVQFLKTFSDKTVMVTIHLHANNTCAAP